MIYVQVNMQILLYICVEILNAQKKTCENAQKKTCLTHCFGECNTRQRRLVAAPAYFYPGLLSIQVMTLRKEYNVCQVPTGGTRNKRQGILPTFVRCIDNFEMTGAHAYSQWLCGAYLDPHWKSPNYVYVSVMHYEQIYVWIMYIYVRIICSCVRYSLFICDDQHTCVCMDLMFQKQGLLLQMGTFEGWIGAACDHILARPRACTGPNLPSPCVDALIGKSKKR